MATTTKLLLLLVCALVAPVCSWAADCGTSTLAPVCSCGDKVRYSYDLTGTFSCSCANANCLRIADGASLTGTGTMVAGTANPSQVGVAIQSGGTGSVSGITLSGAFYDAIAVQDTTAQVSDVTVSGPTHYGLDVYSQTGTAQLTMTGGSVSYAGNEGIHVSDASATLSGVTISHSADEAVYLYGSTGTLTDVTINGFGERPSVASAVYLKDQDGLAAGLSATRLQVTGGDASQGKCVDVTSVSLANSATVDNRTLSNSGMNCKIFVKATAPSSASVLTPGSVCCCRFVTAGSTVSTSPACTATCSAGCC